MDNGDYRLILDGTTYYLQNQTAAPTIGGDIRSASATPLTITTVGDWTPSAPEADLITGGDSQDLLGLSYAPVTETLPLLCRARSAEHIAQIVGTLNAHASLTTAPGVLWCRPRGALQPILFAVTRVEARALALQNTIGPADGGIDVAIALKVRRSYVGGASSLQTLLSATSVTNSSVTALGALMGDMAAEGLPLVVRLDKPTAQSPTRVYLGSVHSRTTATIGSTLSAITTSAAFTASSAISAAPLRSAAGVHLHALARLTSITAPSKALIRVRAQSSSGSVLWQGEWVQLDTATATQLIDLDGSTLDLLRVATAGTPSIVLVAELKSSDGTAVTATLATLEALWCYDWSVVELTTALGSSQRLYAIGAQLIPSGPYLPLQPAAALVSDSGDIPVQAARIRGLLPRAVTGASLFVAWCDLGGAHTASDTANLTIQAAPLWRSARSVS